MKKKSCALAGGLLALFLGAPAAFGADEPKGLAIYRENKCAMCHAISTLNVGKVAAPSTDGVVRPPDLAKVGAKRNAAWIDQWLMKKVDVDGKTHKVGWKGTPEDKKIMVDWLATLGK